MTRTESAVLTRNKIVDSALQVAARAGFARATTKEIAGRAKCSEGIIYHYFKDKSDLFLAVIKENAEHFFEQLTKELSAVQGARNKLERLVDFHFRYFRGEFSIFQILFGKSADASVPFPYLLKTVIIPYQQLIEGIIREGAQRGEFRKVSPELVASNLLGMMQFNIIKMHFGVTEVPPGDAKALIKQLIFKALSKDA